MDIFSSKFIISNTNVSKCPKGDLPEYAFIGRSNVGKSSLINRLTHRKDLAMTSSKPGKTMLINHFLINENWYLVDLPGYGYAKRDKKGQSQIERIINQYILEREQLTNLFLLIDSRIEPQKIDVEFVTWLGENQIPFSIIFTKIDKSKKSQKLKNINLWIDTLKQYWEELPPYFITSSVTGEGRDEVLNYIHQVNNQMNQNK